MYIQPYALCVPIRLSRYIFTFVRVSTALRTYVLTLSGHVSKKSRGDDFFVHKRVSTALGICVSLKSPLFTQKIITERDATMLFVGNTCVSTALRFVC